MVGIVAIGMNARDAEVPLTDQVRERVPNLPPGARLSARHRANAFAKPYTRSAALSRSAPPSELARS